MRHKSNRNALRRATAPKEAAIKRRDADQILHLVEEWLKDEASNNRLPAEDTINDYILQVKQWFTWCIRTGVAPLSAKRDDVVAYCSFLISIGARPSSILFKLAGVRKFYDVAIRLGLTIANPGSGVTVKADWPPPPEKNHLSASEADLLFQSLGDGNIIALRDRAIIALMAIEGLRRLEIVRLNVADITDLDDSDSCKIFISRNKSGSYIFPCEQSVEILRKYLVARGTVNPDTSGEPVFVAVDKTGSPRRRLSRIGLNYVIDRRLKTAGLKEKGRSCQALRNTCAYLLYERTRDINAVQSALRYSNLASAQPFAEKNSSQDRRLTGTIPIKGR